MKVKFSSVVVFLSICFVVLVATIQPGRTQPSRAGDLLPQPVEQSAPSSPEPGIPLGCALQPERNPAKTPVQPARPIRVPLSRFRHVDQTPNAARASMQRGSNRSTYTPREEIALADPTNFGDRYIKDINGRLASYEPIIVLHETVGSASSAINYFQTPHPRDEDQVSYHTLIGLDGTVYYLVPPDKRAFGAGNSVFLGANGEESVQTNPNFPPSVNNFAYHISLETPADGDNNNSSHSGYTNAQYQSLAWLVAKTSVPNNRITFHKIVDRSRSRQDPRSFNTQAFLNLLETYPKTNEITIGCSIALTAP
jgi:hypothetical protein